MNIRKIDNNFSVTGQISPEKIKAIAEAGFKSIICVRPDDEERGQPCFNTVARAAEAEGLQIVHIPVSGQYSEEQLARFQDVWPQMRKPVLSYCRSGTRAANLYVAQNE